MSARTARRLAACMTLLYVATEGAGLAIQFVSGTAADIFGFPGEVIGGLIFLAWAVVGAMIIASEPGNAVGWVIAGIAFEWALEDFAFGYATYALTTHPGSLPAGAFAAITYNAVFFVAEVLLVLLFLLFPHGRALSPRWRAVGWVAAAAAGTLVVGSYLAAGPVDNFAITNPYAILPPNELFGTVVFVVLFASLIASIVALVVRLRRAQGELRQQMRWFVYAASFVPIAFALIFFGRVRSTDVTGAILLGVAIAGVPVASAIAIFKYRLYDIDVVISKTVVFGALAVFITAVYVAIVVGLGAAIGTRGEPNLGLSILATAIVAVAFQPVRERVQRFANRLVYGERASPYEVLSSFASNMASTYAADDLLPRMSEILASGTGAVRAEVWLKVGPVLRRAAVHPPGADAPPEAVAISATDAPQVPGATRSVPVRHRGELLGALALTKAPGDPLTPAEDDLLADLAGQAGLVLRNVGLIEELKASRQRIVAAQDAERRRLERDIHDGAQQRLVGLALAMQMARANLAPEEHANLATGLDDARDELNTTLAEIRDLARGIHPAILTEEGLVAALESLSERSAVPTAVRADAIDRLPSPIEATAYFAVSEALTNVAKYARASRAEVQVVASNGSLRVEVDDDGVGGADPGRGSGLRGLMDRVAALDGRFALESLPGTGTRMVVELPCG